ncbi:amino acid adenylation domain-containing protein [Psychrobacter sp.]|uniref:amino acid adenylation domain-containing protein n=1 Tax=Psychrobacter sp. TaxID=56811 RepID=UPI003C777B72
MKNNSSLKRLLTVALFEKSVKHYAEKPALFGKSMTLNFSQLNIRVNQLAFFLANKGIVKGEPVLFCFERGADAIIALLALFKLGAPCVPVGYSSPAARIKMVAQDVNARFALVDIKGSDALSDLNIDIINIEQLTELEKFPTDNPSIICAETDVAWIIYTSGSTGRPKGVMGTHLGLLNRLEWMWKAQPFKAGEVCFQNTAFTTVDSFWEIFGPLCQGVPLQLLPDDVVQDANLLVQALSDYSIRRICLVPSYLSTILTIFPDLDQRAPTTDLWVVSGEPLAIDVCKRFYDTKPHSWLSNQYGLTESCADVTCFDTRSLPFIEYERSGELTVPIGRPIDNVQLFILDEAMNEVSIGVEGEIYLGGDCVSAGYLGQDSLTRQCYIDIDFNSVVGKRLNFSGTLFRTGDRAAWRQDGELSYKGRKDEQVKMNGYRIELSEIESVLQRHSDIQDTAALIYTKNNLHCLATFVTIKPESFKKPQLILTELRQLAVERLPTYMVPSIISISCAIPRTSTGKIDRKELEQFTIDTNALSVSDYHAPLSEIELWLSQQWSVLLNIPTISAEVNFFTLGGHSLLAIQLLSLIKKHFNIEISLRSFFHAPTIRALAIQMEKSKKTEAYPDVIIPQHTETNEYPLSFPQQQLWFLSELNPDLAVYHIPISFELKGSLDVNKLQQAFDHVSRSHSLLRARFIQNNNQVIQMLSQTVHEIKVCNIEWLAHIENEKQQVELSKLLSAEAKQIMDLANDGALRATLYRITKHHYYFALTFHHIIADGWSINFYLTQLSDAYNALCEERKLLHIEQKTNYFDFAVWQRTQMESSKIIEQLEYWKEKLKNNNALLAIPTDMPRPKSSSYRGSLYQGRISKDTLVSIKNLGLKHGASSFMTLLAVFSTFLAKYSGCEDVIVGTPASNRHYSGVENIFGLFVNTVAIRSSCHKELLFSNLLEQVRDTTLAAFENQDIPFNKIVEALQQERNLSFNPIFQVMFDYQHTEELNLQMNGIQSQEQLVDISSSRFDLSISVLEDKDGALVKLEYSTDIFLLNTIERFFANFNALLENIARQPDGPLHSYAMTCENEKAMLSRWNDTKPDFSLKQNVSQMFSQRAAMRGDATAIVCKDKHLSYKELNDRSNQLARYLQSCGAGPNQLVAVSLERSADMVTALLAVMKAGAAYVPIDPLYPVDRVKYMLTESDAKILITSTSLQKDQNWYQGEKVLIDTDWERISKLSDNALPSNNSLEDIAYVIFTSGSTGKPKGVQVVHRGLSNLVLDMQQRLKVTENDTFLSVTTISFDIAGLELYLPLIAGAKLLIASQEEASNGEQLIEIIDENKCSIMQATPVTWHLLLTANWQCPAGFKILCGGEALSKDLARTLTNSGAELWNVYGPTETTIWSTAERLYPDFDRITIGRPIANTTIHILDDRLQAVAIGVIGDLYIGGAGLARGYHQRPDLTKERFIEHPSIGRLYFTGDVARFLGDGRIEFLGRSDNQIKLRGFRIELGEIEQCLEQAPEVKQAVVVPVKGNSGNTILVAHVIPKQEYTSKKMDFSLFYFSAGFETSAKGSYQLYLESAKRADVMGFKAIWTPERHFHSVGGQFPNPSVLGAAIAVTTNQIQIRAGSVVLPLHNPIRVVEEWSVVDNLSNGRVGIAFASGWNPKDFILAPENFANRRDVMAESIETVKSLWRGESIMIEDGIGSTGEVSVYPRPQQKELEVWITAAGDPSTFIEAGKIGANILTHLLGQSVEILQEKISLYRQTLREYGHNPSEKTITLMLHAFIWKDESEALEICRKPFSNYLRAHLSLEKMAQSFGKDDMFETEDEAESIIELAFERYSKTSSLIGSVDSCLSIISELKAIGVDEIACLVDFGIESSIVLEGLDYLGQLQEKAKQTNIFDHNLLKEHVRDHLPDYMIPNHITVSKDLPMTSNGKVDRKHLIEHTKTQNFIHAEENERQAQTETQRQLMVLWSEVLDLEVTSIRANFFSIGGHSLLAAQLISKIRNTLQITLPLRAIFDAPTIEQLAQKIEEQVDILKNSLEAEPILLMSTDSNITPLSFAQERLWFISHLKPDSPLYNVPIAFILRGSLNKQVFALAFYEVLATHEVFRTTISTRRTQPSLNICKDVPNILRFVDGEIFIDDNQWLDNLNIFLREEAIKPFDVENEPLIRASLIEINSKQSVFFINVHHLIWDGWSRIVFLEELGKRYSAILDDKHIPFSTQGMAYSEFANWQREYLTKLDVQPQIDYWRSKLSGAPDCLRLPTDYKRSTQLSYQGKVIKTRLPYEIYVELQKLGDQSGVTLFMILLTAYKALLHRLTTQEDIIVGIPIANRHYEGIEKTIGLFVNTVAVRSQCSSDMIFSNLLEAVKYNILDAYDNQDIPFERVVDTCQIKRDLNQHPIFQTMFDMQNGNEWRLDLPGVETEFFEIDTEVARFDLLLAVKEDCHGLEISFEYSTDLFREETVSQFLQYFTALLHSITRNPEMELGSIPLQSYPLALPQIQRFKGNDSVVSAFEQQVQDRPESIALKDGERSITYKELDTKSSELADFLHSKKVISEAPVGILINASLESIVTILAILKVGGVYIPIDCDYPSERINLILNDAQAVCVVTNNDNAHRCQAYNGEVIILNSIEDLPYNDNYCPRHKSKIDKEDLAYVIYTSGSTGIPKGVCIEHQSIIRLVKENNFLEILPNDCVGLTSSIAFDAATFEIWGALLNGATLVILNKATVLDPQKLFFSICKEAISVLWMTSSLFNQQVLANPSMFHSLRALIIGGEALSVFHIQKLLNSGQGPEKLINGYGPTENTTFSTTYDITKHKGDFVRGIPIGRPINNTSVLILDKELNPCPVGIAGEIYLGGQGLARGYLNQPELTKERFIEPNPQGNQSIRLYKSGDCARYLPSGDIEYLGRIDNQIKLRGFRIELGEIEAAMLAHPDINTAVVVAYQENSNEKELAAYFSTDKEITSEWIGQLRQNLLAYLPEFMIPAYFTLIDEIPLNTSGKLDRHRLPPVSRQKLGSHCYQPPRSRVELALVESFQEVLGIEKIGITDNFFQMGGHSLLTLRLAMTLESKFGKPVQIADIFSNPTPKDLAENFTEEVFNLDKKSLITISNVVSDKAIFLIHPVFGLAFPYLGLKQYMPNERIYGLNNPYFGHVQGRFVSIEEQAEYYISEIKKVQPQGPYRLGGWSYGGVVAYEMAQNLRAEGHKVERLVLIDSFFATGSEWLRPSDVALQKFMIKEGIDPQSSFGKSFSVELLHSPALLMKYKPLPYKGRVDIVQASQKREHDNPLIFDNLENHWQNFIEGEFHIHYINATHDDLFKEGKVEKTASLLHQIFSPDGYFKNDTSVNKE